uniref:DUF4780 domain-containing protein n=1 Tax=Cuerna arida TaxID=1464854 RepID=A0A1B6F754_9HEMI
MEEKEPNQKQPTGEPSEIPVQARTNVPENEAASTPASANLESAMETSGTATLSEVEEIQLLQSPDPQTGTNLEEAADQLGKLKLKTKRLSGAQRKQLLKARLAQRGEVFDPKKWRPQQRAKLAEERGQKRGRSEKSTPSPLEQRKRSKKATSETSLGGQRTPGPAKGKPGASTPGGTEDRPGDLAIPGGSGETFKQALTTIKIAVVPENYPDNKLTEEQAEQIQTALIGAIETLEDGDCAQLSGSYVERGAVILSCMTKKTADWLINIVPSLTPWEGAKLAAGERSVLLRVTKVVLKTPKQLASTEPSRLVAMLGKQNPSFDASNWKIISCKGDANGQTLVFLVDDTALKAIKAAGNRACLALWRVPLIILNGGNAKGSAGKPATQ